MTGVKGRIDMHQAPPKSSRSCETCGYSLEGDWNNCPNCGSPLYAVPSHRVFRMHRETPDKIEEHLTLQQVNHKHFCFDFGNLFRPAPAMSVSLPRWLYIACIVSVLLVPFARSWIALGVESQVLLYAVYKAGTDRRKLWGMLLLVFAWAMCLLAWPPTGI